MQKSAARDVNIESTTPLISPIELVNKIPMTPEVEATVLSGREQIRAILNGEDDRLLMITGPCSIHDEKAALDYASRLAVLAKELSDRLLIVDRTWPRNHQEPVVLSVQNRQLTS